ncbi:MAG: thiolase family protein [Actinomycetia bacterium]|nr:thiolase family protein [Actinomycetes bacterium]
MRSAVIVDAVRTATGKRNGALSGVHPVDLAAATLREVVQRNDLDPALVEDVIMGCVTQTGGQSYNIARNASLAAGFPESVVGTTVDRQCGSSQQALHFAAQGVMAGAYDVVIAAGVEHMTAVPMGVTAELGDPYGPSMHARYATGGEVINQGVSAEMIAARWGIDREALDAFSLESHRRAAAATSEGRFKGEIVSVDIEVDGVPTAFAVDQGIRVDSSMEALGRLRPAFKEDGVVTAGNSSQLSDGSAAVLVMDEELAAGLGLRPLARVHAFALAGVDPVEMLTGPIPATTKVLERAGLALDDIDLVEINEAFASVVLAWERELGADLAKVNVNGGAIALGHPLGCSGARLMTTLVHELVRTGGRFGLQTMCEGGGMANATIVERLT